MKDKNNLTILILFILTITTAVVSNFGSDWNWLALIIMSLSALKFLLVVFQFMDIKEAHPFWKFITVFYIFAIVLAVVMIL
jgi:hypothetical protein